MSAELKKYLELPNSALVLDGGFSTQIRNHVSESADGNPLWCSAFLHSDPEAVKKTHLDYLRAGADIIITNTYQASIDGFKKYLQLNEEESYNLIKSAVKQAQIARDIYINEKKDLDLERKPLIAGSIGPYGASLHNGSEYTGTYINHVSLEDMEEWHKPRIEALIEGGVDLLAIETMPASSEAEMILKFLKNNHPNIKAWVSFSCKDGSYINFGEDFREVVERCWNLYGSQLIAIGVNCTNPKFIESLFSDINDERDDKIIFITYPNSGEIYHPKKGWIDSDKCKPLESYVPKWLNLNVKIIGSCCPTYADNTEKIRKEVEKWVAAFNENRRLKTK